MTAKAKVDRRLPRGVYALSLLMFLAGGILLLAALILPIQGTNFVGASVVPWYFYIGYAAYFLVVGWGLWAGRRWAYLAALLMCVVLAFYQFRTAIVLGTNALVQFLLIGAIFVYLIQTGVRNAFLRAGDQPEPRAEDGG
ncbi:MAG TPA: hypothetical protein VF897_00570 [Roseiflexaceae bacterium]